MRFINIGPASVLQKLSRASTSWPAAGQFCNRSSKVAGKAHLLCLEARRTTTRLAFKIHAVIEKAAEKRIARAQARELKIGQAAAKARNHQSLVQMEQDQAEQLQNLLDKMA